MGLAGTWQPIKSGRSPASLHITQKDGAIVIRRGNGIQITADSVNSWWTSKSGEPMKVTTVYDKQQ